MNKIVSIYKPKGFTPLQVITKLREQFSEYASEKIGYAGRLDPLAHGVLLLMIGDATKERDKYLSLDKTYEFEVLFCVQTDTYDLLGIPHISLSDRRESKSISQESLRHAQANKIKPIIDTFIKSHIGKHLQSYPPYSSKAVKGKPLFWWAKEKKLHEIEIPKKEIEINSFEALSFGEITKEQLQNNVQETIEIVLGDFRQEEIKNAWDRFFQEVDQRHFLTTRFRIECSSGTYVRELVNQLGKVLGPGAVTLDILRTKVGEYRIEDAIKL